MDCMQNIDEVKDFFAQQFPNGVGGLGKRYFSPVHLSPDKIALENIRIFTVEYIFETIRQMHFPYRPSRFESLFACRQKQDIEYWAQTLSDVDHSTAYVKIVEVTAPQKNTFDADAFWRDQNLEFTSDLDGSKRIVFSPFFHHYNAYRYWKGDISDTPKHEILCRLPVDIKDCIPLSTFLDDDKFF